MADTKSPQDDREKKDRAAEIDERQLDQASGGAQPVGRPRPAEPINDGR
jgi:hypothetical protein